MQHKGSGYLKESKVRVLLVVRWPVGGIRTFHRYVYNNFAPEKYEFTLVAPDIDEVSVLLKDLASFQIKHIKISSTPSIAELGKAVFKALKNGYYSLVHAHGLTSGLSAALPAKLYSVPLLITLHDVFVEPIFQGVKGKGKKIVLAQLWRITHTIHCVSCDCRENLFLHFPDLQIQDKKIITIANGIDVENFLDATPIDLKITDQLPVYLIGFLGRFMAQKGFCYLVEALEIIIKEQRLLPVKPLILTFGTGGFFREEKNMLEKKGLIPYFRFLPFEANIASVLKGLDLVVMPSLWEACPLQPMEALVAGVPFVGTNCLGLREVLQGTPARVVPLRDSQALAEAILQEMENPSVGQCKAFQEEAAQRFNVKDRAIEVENLYQSIIVDN